MKTKFKQILLASILGLGVTLGIDALMPQTANASAVWVAHYQDGSTIYYDDSSIYWGDNNHFSVCASDTMPSGRTTYYTMKFFKQSGTWYVNYEEGTYPVYQVPMANAVFNALVG